MNETLTGTDIARIELRIADLRRQIMIERAKPKHLKTPRKLSRLRAEIHILETEING